MRRSEITTLYCGGGGGDGGNGGGGGDGGFSLSSHLVSVVNITVAGRTALALWSLQTSASTLLTVSPVTKTSYAVIFLLSLQSKPELTAVRSPWSPGRSLRLYSAFLLPDRTRNPSVPASGCSKSCRISSHRSHYTECCQAAYYKPLNKSTIIPI